MEELRLLSVASGRLLLVALAPLDPGTVAALRLLVFGLRHGTRARTFGPVLHLGVPGGEVFVAPADCPDHSLRTDLVLTLLAMHRDEARPTAWLTRTGLPDEHDLDLAWLAAARAGFAESAAELPWFAVVTKHGWRRPATGEGHRWKRLRLRGTARVGDG